MEDILELYGEPYDACYPVVCFDESPYQLVSEVRQPLPPLPGMPARYDYEYRREGTCNLFMCLQPLVGWRHVEVTERRTARDFAYRMQALVMCISPRPRWSRSCWTISTPIRRLPDLATVRREVGA
jgi:hypothetical protein